MKSSYTTAPRRLIKAKDKLQALDNLKSMFLVMICLLSYLLVSLEKQKLSQLVNGTKTLQSSICCSKRKML